ncbi:MAG: flagellar basal body P-ring protein FlgI [Candidatus Margulisbacteria bacterium]|nr:flagellar basal body P-ring protein FlgI [Candidatus Margulisiibacteriota bacterium]
MLKKVITLLIVFSLCFPLESRIKEIAHLEDARSNQIMGYGLVVGLKNSGDSAQVVFTYKSILNLLKKMGISPDQSDIKSRNTASVMVTAELAPFAKPGQKIDVYVSSLGDATSLRGGTLLFSNLVGPDGVTYMTAQGNIVIGGLTAESGETKYQKNEPNRGVIPNGGIVEKEIPVVLRDENYLTLLLNNPDFITAARMSLAIEKSGLGYCDNYDAGRVKVRLTQSAKNDMVNYIARLLDVKVIPDSIAKIVISERTGTIVIGEKVQISPVAVNFGDISIKIEKDIFDVTNINVTEKASNFKMVKSGNTLSDLVKSLNALGTKPSTLISILQAIKAAGAITAEIEVI